MKSASKNDTDSQARHRLPAEGTVTNVNNDGRYKANFTKGGLMVAESRIVAALLLQGVDAVGWKQAIEADNALAKRSLTTASTKAGLIRGRCRP